ncbi:CapA family protein [Marininema halotolerans]|uniref:Poly-gamma-glutamate synthesis protein (Capsule biosynthesis protein) n=1 Tax=Marininema halotolerans TaxID=1155944 RepID=A0A1I6R794_9BACL|nr:CapA family protein [Marininema halotolerans]SFS60546.1 poly-gamma-glutamate synthesis protein (capsule biosynthesis protein) [Marininema halotolerans]
MQAKKIQTSVVLILLSLFLLTTGCAPFTEVEGMENNNQPTTKPTSKPKDKATPKHLRLAIVGDLMLHDSQIRAGKTKQGDYDYHSFFSEVTPWLEQADWALGNLETTLPGEKLPYSGYPRFHAPDAFGKALADAGFDFLSTANNHSMDAGVAGVLRTHRKLKELGIQPIGTSITSNRQKPVIAEKNGMRVSFASYTYGTNGIPVPKENKNILNQIDLHHIRQDLRYSQSKGTDFKVVILHFGQEYQRSPNQQQRELVQTFLKSGADIVLGSHPHVLQPMERLQQDGDEKFVIYSLGNFVSDQLKPYTNDGLILYLDLLKEKNKTQLDHVSYIPTYVHKYNQHGIRQFKVLPLLKDPAKFPPSVTPAPPTNNLVQSWKNTRQLMNSEEDFPVFSTKE